MNTDVSSVAFGVGRCADILSFIRSSLQPLSGQVHSVHDLANSDQHRRNPVGIIVVGGLFVIFSILLVWTVIRDQSDMMMVIGPIVHV